jgi:hypothetical protein
MRRRRPVLHPPIADGSVTWAGMQDSGCHKGLEFTNVFSGSLSEGGNFVVGEWADVPRGATASSGVITLGIWTDPELRLLKVDGRQPADSAAALGSRPVHR